MTCEGCLFGVGYYPLTAPPFLHAIAGFNPGSAPWPDGKCEPTDASVEAPCTEVGCWPIGTVTVANNWVQHPIRIHYRTYSGNNWGDYTLQNFGQAMFFGAPGFTIPCGTDHVAAEVWDDTQNPPVKVGEVKLSCSKCEDVI